MCTHSLTHLEAKVCLSVCTALLQNFQTPKTHLKICCQLQVAKVGTSSSALHLIFCSDKKKNCFHMPHLPYLATFLSFSLSFSLSLSMYIYIYIYRNTHNPMNVSKWKICMISGHTILSVSVHCHPCSKVVLFLSKNTTHNHVCTNQSFKGVDRDQVFCLVPSFLPSCLRVVFFSFFFFKELFFCVT
jgi:hypothetical protein